MAAKMKALGCLIIMFLLGIVVGAAWQGRRNFQSEWHQLAARRQVKGLAHELHLTHDQEVALQNVFKEAHRKVDQIHESVRSDLADVHQESMDSIHKILTPEQHEKFQRLHPHSHPQPTVTTPQESDDEGSS